MVYTSICSVASQERMTGPKALSEFPLLRMDYNPGFPVVTQYLTSYVTLVGRSFLYQLQFCKLSLLVAPSDISDL